MLILVEVSIIVPVYNVEQYLQECLDSLTNQTFEDLEIICINDGSSDKSLEILEKYAEDDSRISIMSQQNSGLSATRNVGMKQARGKYIYFMDSDDILELNAIEKLYNLAEDKSLDFILFKLINFYHETGERFESQYYNMSFLKELVGDNVFSYEDIKDVITKIAVNVQSKFYRFDLIKDMEFQEGLIFEDNPYFIEAMFKAKRAYFLDEFLNLKRERKDSITTSSGKNFADVIPISNIILDLTHKYGHYDELKKAVIKKKMRRIMVRYNEIDEEFKQYFLEKIKDDFISRKDEYEDTLVENSLSHQLYTKTLDCDTYKEFDLVNQMITQEYRHKKILNRYRKVRKYNTARILFKNHGGENNNVEIIESSDDDLLVKVPKWLCDEEGQAVSIQSDVNSLDLKLKITGDGLLKMKFGSYNFALENDEKFLIYVDYTDLHINDKKYLFEDTLASFNEQFLIEKRVKDSEIIDVHVEWRPIIPSSNYVNKYKRDLIQYKKDYASLNGKYRDEKEYNKKLHKEIKTLKSTTSWKVTKPLRTARNAVRRK